MCCLLVHFIAAMVALEMGQVYAQSPAATSPTANSLLRETVCGPQSVKRVLEYYGCNIDLTDLIYELQWPDVHAGSCLADIAKSLTNHHVYVRAVLVPAELPICWPHPVIVHFMHDSGGHFAVLLPSPHHAQGVLWSRGRVIDFPGKSLLAHRTDIILLTSPCPINDSDLHTLTPAWRGLTVLAIVSPVIPLSLVLFLLRRPSSAVRQGPLQRSV